MTLSKKMIPYLLICGISYYLLPLINQVHMAQQMGGISYFQY